ncbi:MAG: hypothetical protein Q8P17_04815 [bacterium]|nr:hypothetical protein [bacterium]
MNVRPNQRVMIVKGRRLHDTGRFLRAGYVDGELQIVIRSDALVIQSDALGGGGVVFWFFREQKSWRFLTQAWDFNPGIYEYTSNYLIEGIG